MSIQKDEQGNIVIRQGDAGRIFFNGFSTDKNYTVYFSVVDENRNLMFPELVTTTNNTPTASFYLDSDSTKLLTVPEDEEIQTYYWGLKYVETGSDEENTVFPKMFQKCLLLVCPQYTEGPI